MFFSGLKNRTQIFVPYFEDTESFFFSTYQEFSINICSTLGMERYMKKSKILHHQKQILSSTSAFALAVSLVMVMMSGGGIMSVMTTTTQQQAFAQATSSGGEEETLQAGGAQQSAANTTTTTGGQPTTIVMTPTEVNGTYRWSVDNNINPTITLVANANNTITVNNPTDEVHELVIAMAEGGGAATEGAEEGTGEEGGELANSGDVQPGGQGQLSIMPNATQSLRYYCEYHPETMLGEIRITNTTTTITDQTQ
jgi:hypothetical protein